MPTCSRWLMLPMAILALALPRWSIAADAPDDQFIPGRWLSSMVPEQSPEPTYPDYDRNDSLEKARIQMQCGQYRRALATLEMVHSRRVVDVALIRGQCLWTCGDQAGALAVLSAPDVANDIAVATLRARVQASDDDYTTAVATLRQALAGHPDDIPARYYLADFLEQSGDIPAAKSAYAWFVTAPHNLLQQWQANAAQFTDAQSVTLMGKALDRWATLTGEYPKQRTLHDLVLSMFIRAYNLIDAGYWPAHLAAAQYFYLYDDHPSAEGELKDALAANPHDIGCWLLVGKMQLDRFNFDGADHAIAEIRAVDPDSIDADLLETRNLLAQRVPRAALPVVQRAMERRPRSIQVLGLAAATQALMLHDQQMNDLLHRADAINPASPVAYFEVAEQLAAMRQYPRAIAMYQVAIARAPSWTSARNGLGLLYTQSGDEDASRKELDLAHQIDPFNISTTNYLRLLDQMQGFARKESAHFIVMYDARQDPIIPEYFSDYLESIYPQVCGAYDFSPALKTMIEVFPTHDAFSVRTTGSPWIATVGASTGRVIAMVAPRKGEATMGPFNWSQVLRHEFTHTVTLGATDNRIPLWFTEGLAVQQEHSPIRWEWVPMLYNAVKNHGLFPMDQLTWAFVRPRKPIDRQLAYAQSSWICQYIEQTYGHGAILSMLAQFRIGHDQDQAIEAALHCSTTQFFDEFQGWCEQQVAGWGYDPASTEKYNKLRVGAEALVKAKKYSEAVAAYEQIARLRPEDLLPHQRLAGLYMAVNDPQKAVGQLAILAAVELNNDMYTKGAARLEREVGDYPDAEKFARKAVYIDPYDTSAHELLVDIDQHLGKTKDLDRENRVIAELKVWQQASTQPSEGE